MIAGKLKCRPLFRYSQLIVSNGFLSIMAKDIPENLARRMEKVP